MTKDELRANLECWQKECLQLREENKDLQVKCDHANERRAYWCKKYMDIQRENEVLREFAKFCIPLASKFMQNNKFDKVKEILKEGEGE